MNALALDAPLYCRCTPAPSRYGVTGNLRCSRCHLRVMPRPSRIKQNGSRLSPRQIEEAHRLFEEQGWTAQLLAEHYGVSYHDIRNAFLYTYGTTKRRDHIKANVVSQLLGHRNYWYVRRWIRDGELPAVMGRSVQPALCPDWYVARADLMVFLHKPDKWMRWEPSRITNPSIRAYATDIRAEVPWRWMRSRDEGAAFFSCSCRVLQSYILNGFLPGVVEGREWFIRSDHAAQFVAKINACPPQWGKAFRADPPAYAP